MSFEFNILQKCKRWCKPVYVHILLSALFIIELKYILLTSTSPCMIALFCKFILAGTINYVSVLVKEEEIIEVLD